METTRWSDSRGVLSWPAIPWGGRLLIIPLGDDNSRRTLVPVVNIGLIVANVLVFVFELARQGEGTLNSFLGHWSVLPAAYAGHAAIGGPVPATLFTAMFLHAGWAHLLGNMVYLGIFGDNVESALGHGRYLAFYLACGVAAALAQIVGDPGSTVPMLGASGAISGVLAGYLIFFPHNRVSVWFLYQVAEVPALVVIGGLDRDAAGQRGGHARIAPDHGRSGVPGARGRVRVRVAGGDRAATERATRRLSVSG